MQEAVGDILDKSGNWTPYSAGNQVPLTLNDWLAKYGHYNNTVHKS